MNFDEETSAKMHKKLSGLTLDMVKKVVIFIIIVTGHMLKIPIPAGI